MTGLLFTLIIPAIPHALPAQSETEQIQQWIENLGSKKYSIRTAAEKELINKGLKVLPILEKALKSSDLETRKRVKQLLIRIPQAHLMKSTKMGRESVALMPIPGSVDRGGRGGPAPVGGAHVSAVCIHPSGLFLMAYRSLQNAPTPTRKLILHPGTEEQKEVAARVMATDPSRNLVIVHTEEKIHYPALALGDPKALAELEEVSVLSLSVPNYANNPNGFQPVAPYRGSISAIESNNGIPVSLHYHSQEAQEAAQIVASTGTIIPGPVLDAKGNLLAIPSTTFSFRSGEGNAPMGTTRLIPVSLIQPFLSQPLIKLTLPVFEESGEEHRQAKFQAEVIELSPGKKPLTLEIELSARGPVRKQKMATAQGKYHARMIPLPRTNEKPKCTVAMDFADGLIEAKVPDQMVAIDGKSYPLRDIREIQLLPDKARALLHNDTQAVGKLSGLKEVEISLNGITRKVDLSKAMRLAIVPPARITRVICTVKAYRDGKVVGEVSKALILPYPPI